MNDHPFGPHLESGEELRWVGRPRCDRARRSIRPVRIFALALTPVALMFWVIASALDLAVAPLVLAILSTAIPLLGLYLPVHDRRHLERLRFAVTNRAALISVGDRVQRFGVGAAGFAEFMDGELHNLRIGHKAGRFQVFQGSGRRITVPVAFEMLASADARAATIALAPLLGRAPST